MPGPRRTSIVASVAALVGLCFLCLPGSALAAGTVDGAALSAQQSGRDVTIDVQVGVNGVVPAGVSVPVRVVLTSTRARSVELAMSWVAGERSLEMELAADTATEVEISVRSSPSLELSVTTPGGDRLAGRDVIIDADPGRTLVGIGPSLGGQGAPETAPTIGGVQDASLVTLTDDLWSRPATLGAMSGIVLGAADLDGLTDGHALALREWVWAGGDLALDVEPRADLPVVDMASVGTATAVGAGWVRFTDGRAASGAWSEILEPSVITTSLDGGAGGGFDGMGGFVDLDSFGLVQVGFLPIWVIVVAVFGTALLAGPVVWFLLRDRRRRQWMWVAAPAISIAVAVALLVVGQGVFTSADTRIVSEVRSSPWSSAGTVLSGLKESAVLELPPGADLVDSDPTAALVGTGAARSVRIALPRNSFGTVGLSTVTLDEGPRIEVTATANADRFTQVTVRNDSAGTLTDVKVSGNGRVHSFADVGPAASATGSFNMGSNVPVFGPVFPREQNQMGMIDDFIFDLGGQPLPESTGVVMITGEVRAPVSAAGLSGAGVVSISSVVPIGADDPGSGAMRIDALGGLSFEQLAMEQEQDEFDRGDQGDGPAVVPGPGGDLPVLPPDYVRFSFPGGRPAGACGMHTIATELSLWDGAQWVPLAKVGEPYETSRIVGLTGEDSQMQGWMLPAVEPGDRLHLRVGGRTVPTPAALLFDCEPRP